MELRRRTFATGVAFTVAALLAGCNKKSGGAVLESAVKKDLQTAFNGESTATAKYALYAAECEKAGYLSLATFFKAASFAESVHAGNHAKTALKLFGVKMVPALKPFAFTDVKSAVEDALAGETYEYTEMYPAMVEDAQSEKLAAAVRTFDTARKAETEHGRIYREALADLDGWKAAGRKFWICPVCGFTTDKALEAGAKCPYCGVPSESFKIFG